MTNERILDILSKSQDYYGPLYKTVNATQSPENEPQKQFNVEEIKIIDVFEIGTDSAVVLWKRKSSNMLRYVALATLIINGRVNMTMQAREYMRALNIRVDNGDHRLNVPSSAAGYLLYLASVGAGYRAIDNEFEEKHIERYTRGDLIDVIEDEEGYRPRIYSIFPIGGTGTIAVQYSVKKEDYIPGKPRARFAIISDSKIIVANTLPTNKFNISYNLPNGEKRYIDSASSYADMWLTYGAANSEAMQNYFKEAIATAYDNVNEKEATEELIDTAEEYSMSDEQ